VLPWQHPECRPTGQGAQYVEPGGKQLRASVYMAYHKLYVTEAEATAGDTNALLFEQSITLIDHAGANIDRVNAQNDTGRPFDCK